MKRILIVLSVAAVILLLGGVWFFRSMQNSGAAHGAYHECQMNRQQLDLARYWYALDNGMTNAPGLTMEELLPYIEDQKASSCPSGGIYSVDSASLHVACSIPQHMFDSCLGNSAHPQESDSWVREYPLDYRSSDSWLYCLNDMTNGTLFRMSGATIVFRDAHGWGGGCGTMEVSGMGTSHGSSGSGDRLVTDSYSNGTYTCHIAGHVVRVTEHGRTLQIDTNAFDLSKARPRILVGADGASEIGGAANQSGAANGSQPIRSETNRRSSAAGSGR